jgi:RND family efflux transporter MFP subunit
LKYHIITNLKSKTMVKQILTGVVVVGLLVAMGFVLKGNKEKIEASKQLPPVKAVAVTVQTVEEKTFSDNLSILGTIVANKEVNVVAETQGKVLEVAFKNGDAVSQGQTLVRVDSELRSAGVMAAQVNYDKAQADLNRYEALLKDKSIPEAQVEAARFGLKAAEAQLITAKRQLADTKVTAPFSGVINSKNIEVGAMLQIGTAVASLIDINNLKVKVSLAEKEVFKIKRGDKVSITTDVYTGYSFDGVVDVIGAKGDEAHNYPVEIMLQNNDSSHPLKAGMFCKVSFGNLPSRNMVAIPREALVGSAKQPQVYVINQDKAQLKDIVLGSESGTYIEVLKGLEKGEQVIVNGQINLNDGMAVTIIK